MDIDVSRGDEIARVWRHRMARMEFLVMTVRSTVVTATGDDRIESRTVLSEFGRTTDGNGVDMYGSYSDVIVTEDGRWVYRRRSLDVIYRGTPTVPGVVYAEWPG